MTTIQAMPGRGAGYVRAIFSGRCRGFAAPVDLLRVQLRSANRLSAIRHNEAMYARLSEDFGGYLVTDSNPCEMTAAEMAACWPFDDRERVFAFSDSRWKYENDRPSIYRTGWGPRPSAMQEWAEFAASGACLDASWWIAAGSVAVWPGIPEGMPSSVARGAE